MTYSKEKLKCESFDVEDQNDFLRITDTKVDIDRILLEIESVLGFKDEWYFGGHIKEGPNADQFDNRQGATAWLQMPEEYIADAYHGWRKPLNSFLDAQDKPWTKICKWTYRECKHRKFLNPACQCFFAFESFCFDLPYTNKLIQDLGMYKSFVSIVPPFFAIENHQDPIGKLHIPLETHNDIYLSIDVRKDNYDSVKSNSRLDMHLPSDGSVYYVNTRKWHSVVNMSGYYRLHLVGDFDHNRLDYV